MTLHLVSSSGFASRCGGDHPLLPLDNILFTPHLGALTMEASNAANCGAAEEVIRVLEGKKPKNPVIELV